MSVLILANLHPERSHSVGGLSVSESILEHGGLGQLAAGTGSARMASTRNSNRWKRGMSNPLFRIATRIAYGASQLPRIAWYVGHGLAMRRLAEEARRRDSGTARQRAQTNAPVPDRRRLYADMAMLLWQDLANVEAGLYPLPVDRDGSLLTLLHRSRLFFEDLPEIYRRRKSGGRREVVNEKTAGKRPRYYLQNFHFQSGGWMTEESAKRYDTQVEVLFNGTANAMRRQALPQLREGFAVCQGRLGCISRHLQIRRKIAKRNV
jgi:hypothetical protein